MSIDPRAAANRVWAKLVRSHTPRLVFVSLTHGGRVLTVRVDAGYAPPPGRIVGVYDSRADPDVLLADIRELLARLNLLPSNSEQTDF